MCETDSAGHERPATGQGKNARVVLQDAEGYWTWPNGERLSFDECEAQGLDGTLRFG